MKLIPNYIVSYNGVWHYPGEAFEISPADEKEMSQHGRIIEEKSDIPAEEPKDELEIPAEEPKKTTKKK